MVLFANYSNATKNAHVWLFNQLIQVHFISVCSWWCFFPCDTYRMNIISKNPSLPFINYIMSRPFMACLFSENSSPMLWLPIDDKSYVFNYLLYCICQCYPHFIIIFFFFKLHPGLQCVEKGSAFQSLQANWHAWTLSLQRTSASSAYYCDRWRWMDARIGKD